MVVGLGNPGRQYADTPHNVGFMAMDCLAERLNAGWKRSLRFRARAARAVCGGEPLLLVKPQTYMNRSGAAAGALARYHRLAPADVIVVLDDADLDAGRLRVRPRGGSGGHRGLQSLIEAWGGEDFARVRVGIGRPRDGQDGLVDHVLSRGTQADRERLKTMAARAADAVESIVKEGAEAAMNRFNGREY
jgi:peptidyl-tRNA hydrolase, PTH1 family